MSCPCQNCTSRKPVCHDKCEAYIDWHDQLVMAKEAVHTANKAVAMLVENYVNRRDSWRKKMGRLG